MVLAPVDVRLPASAVARLLVASRATSVRVAGGAAGAEDVLAMLFGKEGEQGEGRPKRTAEDAEDDEEGEEDEDEEDEEEDSDRSTAGETTPGVREGRETPTRERNGEEVPDVCVVRIDRVCVEPTHLDAAVLAQAWKHPVGRFLARVGRLRIAPAPRE